ncbi:hypothetical protein Pint_36482 [Pistacia integerrima]|uniref:Uncharacterized protein n=1 Tax=Pistacia integerrima TaxID=434235 RepID=A0ACC0Y0T4_9ROSI|nr:hypothetical protein Pint_36482 [Pistacia integerrima]
MQSAKEDIEKRVETAKKNDEEIFKTVQDWQDDTRKILEEVQMLNKEIEHNQLKTCFNGWCPNWGSRHQLGRKATKTSIQLKEIIDRGQSERVGCRALLSETNFEENIGVPLSKGCKMLLTTRNQKVYGHKEYQSLIPLNVLKGHEGVALLKRQAGIDDDCAHLDSLATQIARECDGLPLALVTTGRYLRGKKENKTWEVLEREKDWTQYTTISLLENKLKELSVRLGCPKLKILLLGGEKQSSYNYDKSKLLKVADECFEEMKALEVVSLRYADLSLKSLQFLTNLKTLELFGCNLRDISFLAKLNKLEILSFRGSYFDELPIELSELKELKMLDLRGCSELRRIPSNLIRSFSQLEELYIEKDIFEEREIEEKSIETGNARLSEVNDLPRLAVLYLKINSKCLPKDFAFSKLSRYQICVNESLIQLKNLEIRDAAELKQVFHGKEENEVAEEGKDIKLPNLKKLRLYKLEKLTRFFPKNNHSTLPALEEFQMKECPNFTIKEGVLEEGLRIVEISNNQLWNGILSRLRDIRVEKCHKLKKLFPISIARGFQQLERLYVWDNPELEEIFGVNDVIDVKDSEEVGANLLQTLSDIRVKKCHKLKYLFPISIARGFQQLANLQAIDNSELEQIFGDNDVIDAKEIQLPRLQCIILEDLPRLTNFCHVDYHFIFPAPPLDYLTVGRCPKISTRFSWDEENKSVHAEAKAPKIGNAEDDSHEETSTDLFHGYNFEKLPQYIKNEELYSNSHPTE